jgi:hypothetical protein
MFLTKRVVRERQIGGTGAPFPKFVIRLSTL